MSARASQQAVYMGTRPFMPFDWSTVRRALFVVSVSALLGWGIFELRQPDTLPIKKIHALGSFVKVDEAMLRTVIANTLEGGYFAVNVSEVQEAVKSLAWISSASVSRIWPDTISISVVEEQITAVWAKGGLVNLQGAIILPLEDSYPVGLPEFNGPVGMERNMTEFYKKAKQVVEPLGLEISGLNLDSRGAYILEFDNDIEVLLGREQIEKRLERFARVYKKVLAQRATEIEKIDMRYSNGLSVGWRKLNKG